MRRAGSRRGNARGEQQEPAAGPGSTVMDVIRLAGDVRGASKALRRRSLVEGVWNGRWEWLVVAAVMWGGWGVRKARHRGEKVLWRVVLKPGQQVSVREPIVRATRRQRRRQQRSSSPASS